MKTTTKPTKTKATIMLDTDVYEAVKSRVGARRIGEYLSNVARPELARIDYRDDPEVGYKAMAADEAYNREANEWIEGTMEAPVGENDWPTSWRST